MCVREDSINQMQVIYLTLRLGMLRKLSELFLLLPVKGFLEMVVVGMFEAFFGGWGRGWLPGSGESGVHVQCCLNCQVLGLLEIVHSFTQQ